MFELVYLMEFERKISFEFGMNKIISIFYGDGVFKVVTNYLVGDTSAGFNCVMDAEELSHFITEWGLENAIHQRYSEKIAFDNKCESVRKCYEMILENMSVVNEEIKDIAKGILSVLSKGEKFFINETSYLKIVIGNNKDMISFQTFIQKADGIYDLQTCDSTNFIVSLVSLVKNNPELYANYLSMKQDDISQKSIVSDLRGDSRK